jgi:leader peptidase (prepilin peptidase)/N-methyltransferase
VSGLSLPAWLAAAAGLGLVVGSFLNVVIHRLPRMLEAEWLAQCAELRGEQPARATERFNLLFPASHCPLCGAAIKPWQNIPLLSYLLLGGKCRECRARISWRYPLVEATAGILAVLVVWRFGPTFGAAGALVFVWTLLALSAIDLDTQLLPDSLTLPLLWLGLLVNIGGTFTPLASAVAGAAVGYLVLWSVYWLFRLLTGKEGMGFGDFKLLAAIGAWLGWSMLPVVVLLSSFVGAAVGIALMFVRGQSRSTPIPFGPYLAAAGLIAMLWGTELTRQYLALLPG